MLTRRDSNATSHPADRRGCLRWQVVKAAIASIACLICIAVPATALAVVTSPAIPSTISLSNTGAPRCTYLPVKMDHSWEIVTVVIRRPSTPGTFATITARYQTGQSWFKWCGHYRGNTKSPGSYTWYACMDPNELNHSTDVVTCTLRSPKRWVTVVK